MDFLRSLYDIIRILFNKIFYSRLDRKILLFIMIQYLTAFNSHIFIGYFIGSI